MMPGIFISFEGPDGGGKTTQLRLLAEYLRQQGFVVCCTREPGGTGLGDVIRGLLLDPANRQMDARTEALLYMAARAQHIAEVIAPALARGEVVLSDRYADSTIVYQGVARRLAREELTAINHFATDGVAPQLTILLDAEAGQLADRVNGRGAQDRIESEDVAFHAKVSRGFRELAAADPERIKVIAAARSVAEVHQDVVAVVREFLCRRGSREG
jgi:dTMP kinase